MPTFVQHRLAALIRAFAPAITAKACVSMCRYSPRKFSRISANLFSTSATECADSESIGKQPNASLPPVLTTTCVASVGKFRSCLATSAVTSPSTARSVAVQSIGRNPRSWSITGGSPGT